MAVVAENKAVAQQPAVQVVVGAEIQTPEALLELPDKVTLVVMACLVLVEAAVAQVLLAQVELREQD